MNGRAWDPMEVWKWVQGDCRLTARFHRPDGTWPAIGDLLWHSAENDGAIQQPSQRDAVLRIIEQATGTSEKACVIVLAGGVAPSAESADPVRGGIVRPTKLEQPWRETAR